MLSVLSPRIDDREDEEVHIMLRFHIAEEAVFHKSVGIYQLILTVLLEAIEDLDKQGTNGRIKGKDYLSSGCLVFETDLEAFFREILRPELLVLKVEASFGTELSK